MICLLTGAWQLICPMEFPNLVNHNASVNASSGLHAQQTGHGKDQGNITFLAELEEGHAGVQVSQVGAAQGHGKQATQRQDVLQQRPRLPVLACVELC